MINMDQGPTTAYPPRQEMRRLDINVQSSVADARKSDLSDQVVVL